MLSAVDNTTPQSTTTFDDSNNADGYGFGVTRPPPPPGYLELCVLRSKVPDDTRFLSAQNGFTFFARKPPHDDDVEHERRVLYIPSPKSYVPENEEDNTADSLERLTPKTLSDLIVAIVDKTHYDRMDGLLPTVGVFAGAIAGLFFEPDNEGKAIFVPLAVIARHPERFCGIEGRDYYVLNPDVMEDEATEESLDSWRYGMRSGIFVSGFAHIYVWNHYNVFVGLLVPLLLLVSCLTLWNSDIQLRNGMQLNEKLIDEAFFIYDFMSNPVAWVRLFSVAKCLSGFNFVSRN